MFQLKTVWSSPVGPSPRSGALPTLSDELCETSLPSPPLPLLTRRRLARSKSLSPGDHSVRLVHMNGWVILASLYICSSAAGPARMDLVETFGILRYASFKIGSRGGSSTSQSV